MQFNLLKTKKWNIKVALVWENPGLFLLGFCFLKEYNYYDTRNFFVCINLIFWKIAIDINKKEPLDKLI